MSWLCGSAWPVTLMEIWRMEKVHPKPVDIPDVQESSHFFWQADI